MEDVRFPPVSLNGSTGSSAKPRLHRRDSAGWIEVLVGLGWRPLVYIANPPWPLLASVSMEAGQGSSVGGLVLSPQGMLGNGMVRSEELIWDQPLALGWVPTTPRASCSEASLITAIKSPSGHQASRKSGPSLGLTCPLELSLALITGRPRMGRHRF